MGAYLHDLDQPASNAAPDRKSSPVLAPPQTSLT
jgi:hypothetical protein